jgi:AhpD family alkylhydroperoxidase
MPSFFATMARSPQALEHFMPLYSAVIDKGTVDAKLKDLAYLKTALINGCEYCHRAHSASGKKNGITDEQLKNLAFFQRSEAFDAKEKAVLLYAERVTRGASAIRPPAIQELKQYFNDDQIVELTLTICIANFTNRFNDAMLCIPDIP